jgi:hypothetical protein
MSDHVHSGMMPDVVEADQTEDESLRPLPSLPLHGPQSMDGGIVWVLTVPPYTLPIRR